MSDSLSGSTRDGEPVDVRDFYDRAHKLANEIAQIFYDAEHWNRAHPGEEINPDPDGQLQRTHKGLAAFLQSEADRG